MKKLALAAVLAAAASHANAGAYEPAPVVEPAPVIIEEDTGGTSGGWIIPVLLLALVGVAAAS